MAQEHQFPHVLKYIEYRLDQLRRMPYKPPTKPDLVVLRYRIDGGPWHLQTGPTTLYVDGAELIKIPSIASQLKQNFFRRNKVHNKTPNAPPSGKEHRRKSE